MNLLLYHEWGNKRFEHGMRQMFNVEEYVIKEHLTRYSVEN